MSFCIWTAKHQKQPFHSIVANDEVINLNNFGDNQLILPNITPPLTKKLPIKQKMSAMTKMLPLKQKMTLLKTKLFLLRKSLAVTR